MAIVYRHVNSKKFKPPSSEYVRNVAKTFLTHFYLRRKFMFIDELPIISSVDMQLKYYQDLTGKNKSRRRI